MIEPSRPGAPIWCPLPLTSHGLERAYMLQAHLPVVAMFAISVLAAGCGDDASDGHDASPAPSLSCIDDRLAAQPRHRLPSGSTHFLPTVDSVVCPDATWSLTGAPAGSLSEVVQGRDGYTRFTPVVPGTYSFAIGDHGDVEDLTVIPARDVPFHNLNYYGSSTLAAVGNELWIADVYASSVTRVDPTSLEVLGTIDVGPWPVALKASPGLGLAVVVQRGNDMIGLIDVAGRRLIDAIWVGDEPSNVVLSPDGATAYVPLATEAAVAVVDLEARAVTRRIEVGIDPLGIVLSADGGTLFVASHRSGHTSRYPFESYPLEDERDILQIDLESGAVIPFLEVGTTLNALRLTADGQRLLVANTLNDTEVSLADTTELSFVHELTAIDPADGTRLAGADLSRQTSSGGFAVSLHGMEEAFGRLWVTAEGSDLTLGLDPVTLEEQVRVVTPGRSRAVIALGDALFTHGAQSFTLTRFDAAGNVTGTLITGTDPRPVNAAAGQRYFTGAGRDYAQNWACNSCHLDGLTDTLVWNAGPLDDRVVPRPFFWLEGAYPLGWAGYLSNVRNYAFTVNTNVGIRPNTDEAENLWAYIASIMPPPPANGLTRRDGALSDAALRGQDLFEGKAACIGCHPAPLTTSRSVLPEGITDGVSDIPALVGIYRHNVWMKHGEAATLEAGVSLAVDWLGVSLNDEERGDLTRYLLELTARDFFMLTSEPRADASDVAVDQAIVLTFSSPIFDDAANLARVRLMDGSGVPVAADLEVEGRYATLSPRSRLAHGATYRLEVDAGFEAFAETTLATGVIAAFTTAAPPTLKLEGEYLWTVHVPGLDLESGEWDTENTSPAVVPFNADSSSAGASILLDYLDDLVYPTSVVVAGSTLASPPLPVPVGPSFADSTGFQGTLEDEDGDGIADRSAGVLVLSGPGFVLEDVAWELTRPVSNEVCEEGTTGSPLIEVAVGEGGEAIITWEGVNAISLYVTEPSAILPTGPNSTVKNGETFWALEVVDFDLGFDDPVTYGVVPVNAADSTDRHSTLFTSAAPLEAGTCYKFSVINTSFGTGTRTVKWE